MLRIYTLLFCLFLAANLSAGNVIRLDEDLARLDSAVAQYPTFIAAKQKEIATFRHNSGLLIAASDQYHYNKQLFELYLKFDADSALIYAQNCVKIAAQKGMGNERLMSEIDLAMIYILKGDMDKARKTLTQIGDIHRLEASFHPKLAMATLEFELRENYQPSRPKDKDYRQRMDKLWADYGPYLARDNWMYAYYKAVITQRGRPSQLLDMVRNTPKPSIQAAMLYHAIGLCHQYQGNEKAYYHFLILSAINDIMSANREAMSLLQIINSPFIDKDSKRAVDYAMLCADNANNYNDKWRSLDIVTAHSIITHQYENKLESRETTMKMVIAMLALAVAVICVLLYLVQRRRRKAVELLSRLHTMNQTLQDMVDNEKHMQGLLKTNNDRLEAEIQLRNTNFIEVYQLVSKYIQEVKEFKKSVYNQITAGKIDQARRALSSTSDTEKYKHSFYQQFDQAFLTTHPDFIDKLNTLLLPDCQVGLTETGELTPELRIYALVSLGITDSVSIAGFLHYSTQTVYNYRLKMRHSACIPERTFADTVARFYAKSDV